MPLLLFATADQVRKHLQDLNDPRIGFEPHYSASYRWLVRHPSLPFGSYGFSTQESLLSWANTSLQSYNR